MTSAKGRLLVALPVLRDPNFDRTVVLMLEHDDSGALGVVLNRPSGLELVGALAAWEKLAAPPAQVYWGGPVAQGVAIGVAGGGPTDAVEGFSPLFPGLGTVELGREPDELGLAVDGIRVFVGYAGWGSGQLEGEIEMGAWLVVDADPGDPFTPEPDALWRTVLRRQGGTTAWLARYPDDPRLN